MRPLYESRAGYGRYKYRLRAGLGGHDHPRRNRPATGDPDVNGQAVDQRLLFIALGDKVEAVRFSACNMTSSIVGKGRQGGLS